MQRTSSRYTFGRFHLDAGERCLTRDGQPALLTPKAFDTLLALVQHAGHALSKDDLMRAVWPDGFVEESNLAFNISTLRKALGEGQNGERYIETVPKLGYRFVMPVQLDSPAHPVAAFAKRSNLPAQLTRFIGRERELAEVTALVQTKRLVTLTGSGGVGKTRLAMEAGAQLLDQFVDGVWLAEFAPLVDEALVPVRVAGVFLLQEQPGRSLLDMLVAFLDGKHTLVIFDNCEHVIASSAALAEALLRACPNVHILATSREALRVAGEVTRRVPSLDVPKDGRALTVEQVFEYDAVQLFVEHAALLQPNFTLRQGNLDAVVSICRRLDGIPLAIEMAAAQLDALNLKAIEAGLAACIDFLTHGSRTAAPRHQTLRATLDWSYNLLTEPERTLLARLAVFRGGFTPEAAQAVCEAEHQTLLQLVRKSLVVAEPQGNMVRYYLLETVRQYASEILFATPEYEALQDRHLTFFLKIAEDNIDLEGPIVDAWATVIDAEFANVRNAVTRALVRGDDCELALRLVYALLPYVFCKGHLLEIKEWIDKALSYGVNAPRYAVARAMMAKFGVLTLQGALLQNIQIAQEALVLFRTTQDVRGLAWCLEANANNSFDVQIGILAEEALPLMQQLGSRDGEARVLRALGVAALLAGHSERAAHLLEQSILLAPWDARECILPLYKAHPKRAVEVCVRERASHIARGDVYQLAIFANSHGAVLLAEGEYLHARRILEEGIRGWQLFISATPLDPAFLSLELPVDFLEKQFPFWLMLNVFFINHICRLAYSEVLIGDVSRAQMRLEQCLKISRESGNLAIVIFAELLLIDLMSAGENADATLQKAQRHLQHVRELDNSIGIACSLAQIACLVSHRGEWRKACTLIGAASVLMEHSQHAILRATSMPGIWFDRARKTIVDPCCGAARAALGDEAFEAAYTAGQPMSLDEAVALALNG